MVLLRRAAEKQIKGFVPEYCNIIENKAEKALEERAAGDKIGKTVEETAKGHKTSGVIHQAGQEKGYYAAVDIGTTTLSIEIYDQDGNYIGGHAENNAQGKLGNDVMMRLMHASEGRQEILHTMIRDQIYHIFKHILSDAEDASGISNIDVDDSLAYLRKVTVVGNTVMCHLFLNQNTAGLKGSPFHAAYQGSYQLYGKDLGWSACSSADVIVLPGIAAHVGADAAAVFMAEQLWQKDRIQLAIDLGTNAEIILNDRGKVWVCSAAAGPAFEGKGISCGCRGGSGAVSAVKINRANGNILLDIVPDPISGKLFPRGICGSGLVDLIAELLENKLLQPDGHLLSAQEAKESGISHAFASRLEESNGEQRFMLFDPKTDKISFVGKQTGCLYITQQDIRNFQLAKSAIQTGIALLCQKSGLNVFEIEDCRVAGVFGTFLHLDHAKESGLLPDIPAEAIRFVGNAAGRGAAQALFDPGWIPSLEEKLSEIQHVELAEQKNFQSLFLQNINLCTWRDANI